MHAAGLCFNVCPVAFQTDPNGRACSGAVIFTPHIRLPVLMACVAMEEEITGVTQNSNKLRYQNSNYQNLTGSAGHGEPTRIIEYSHPDGYSQRKQPCIGPIERAAVELSCRICYWPEARLPGGSRPELTEFTKPSDSDPLSSIK